MSRAAEAARPVADAGVKYVERTQDDVLLMSNAKMMDVTNVDDTHEDDPQKKHPRSLLLRQPDAFVRV